MIKSVIGNGRYLVTYNNSISNYTNNYSGAQGLGNMQFNTTNQRIEVWDGQMWQPMQMGDVNVSLTQEAQDAIGWAVEKRQQELRINLLAERHPAVADQLAAVREAEEKLRMITALVQT